MSRAEHLAWSKQRALEYVDAGDLNGAWAAWRAICASIRRRRITAGIELGFSLYFHGHLGTQDLMREFIEVCN